ncbi:MAG: coproporphyrinogen dehydrogenase HemZ [Candidatus Fimenecus sp.]
MILEVLGNTYQYELEKLTRVFFPNEKIRVVFEAVPHTQTEPVCTAQIEADTARVSIQIDAQKWCKAEELSTEDDRELKLASLLFCGLKEVTGYTPQWGLLTGIRPSKLLLTLQAEMGETAARAYFTDRFFVSPQKTALTESVAARETAIIASSRPDSCSLYVAIPFCPTRCSYCSFVSHAVNGETAKKLVPDYVRLLCEEIRLTGAYAQQLGLHLESVYFGGGTPTTLSADDLRRLLAAVGDAFDLSTVREYTVEAGRPDTITREKLDVLASGGVTRISINPQTFNDAVLREIGRKHTAALTEEKFYEARAAGFRNINMDFIAGLPTDTVISFCNSIDKALTLTPENITVHTLSLKRASNLGTQNTQIARAAGAAADEMLRYAYQSLTAADYNPYYMYRQSKTLGNLENTGYAKAGFECIYNIFMMEECHTVFAVGAGAVTKLKAPYGKEIERIFNYKYPYEYISGFAEIEKRKAAVLPFYAQHGI